MDTSRIPSERLSEPMPRWAGDIIRQLRVENERLQAIIRRAGVSLDHGMSRSAVSDLLLAALTESKS